VNEVAVATTHSALDYFVGRQCPAQWQGFLHATASELASRFGPDDLRAVMHGIGARFAAEIELPDSQTVPDMEAAMSAVWQRLDWGYMELEEQSGSLQLIHHCAPLLAAFGEDALTWTPAFLEGAYQQWFVQLGASDVLRVRQVAPATPAHGIAFRFGK
jgi:hypothetical protein